MNLGRILQTGLVLIVGLTFHCGRLTTFNEKLDTNKDGKIDTWRFYSHGQLIRVERDTNVDGKVDQIDYLNDGQITRVDSDRNFDGKFDKENYVRVGKVLYDNNFDGKFEEEAIQ
jgi:hypothetical protein